MKVVEWIATIVTIIGAFLTASNNHPLNLYFLNAGSLLWLVWAVADRRVSIALVNATMLAIYAAGVLKII